MASEIVVDGDWRDRIAALAGRRRESWLLAGVIGVLIAGAVLFFGRSAPAIVAPPARSSNSIPDSSGGKRGAASGSVAVHVAGAVRDPGLYDLPGNLRVADAIEAAGGPARRADLDALNLAQPLTDGERILVPTRGETSAPAESAGAPPAAAGVAVNINTADAAALEQIPGIGPVKAAAILDHRAGIGAFQSIDELLDVNGIGPATLESLRPYVTL